MKPITIPWDANALSRDISNYLGNYVKEHWPDKASAILAVLPSTYREWEYRTRADCTIIDIERYVNKLVMKDFS